jgi:F0F1-type ATP synthase delta subunit
MAYDYIDYSQLPGQTESDKIARLVQLHPDLLSKVVNASKDYYERTGKKLPINRATSTWEEQNALYNRRGEKGIYMPLDPSKYEKNHIFHTDALDISPGDYDTELTKYGLGRPIKGDIVHVMATDKGKKMGFFDNPAPYTENDTSSNQPTTGGFFDNPTLYAEVPTGAKGQLFDQFKNIPRVAEAIVAKRGLVPNLAKPFEAPAKEGMEAAYEALKTKPKEAGKSIAAFLDNTIGGVLPYGAKQVGYLFGRTIGDTPEMADKISSRMASIVDKPFGKAFGITDDPQYKGEATSRLMEFIGNNVNKGAGYISEKTGLPKSDVEWMINTALPKVVEKVGGVAKTGAETAYGKVAPVLQDWQKELMPNAKQEMVDQFNKQKMPEVPPSVEVQPTQGIPQELPKATVEVQQAGAPQVLEAAKAPETQNVIPAKIDNEPTVIHALDENPPEPTHTLTLDEMANREKIMRDVGFETVRKSAIENRPKEASSQFITAQAEQGPYGEGMTKQINHEKEALTNWLSNAEKEAGGLTVGKDTPVSDRIKIGQAIKEDLNSAKAEHDAVTDQLYKEAKNAVGDKPVNLTNFADTLENPEHFLSQDQVTFQGQFKKYLQRLDVMDAEGNMKPMDVAKAEKVRQFLNKNYDYKYGDSVLALKKAIDQDVFNDVGGETYQKAREHFGAGKEMFENPKLMRDLLQEEGVDQKVADENVIKTLAKAPESRFANVIDTLKEKGKNKAISQIQTSLINEVKEAGQSATNQPWNQPAASKRYKELQNKFDVAFADHPELLEKVHKGLLAGEFSHIPSRYPGAAVQTHLLQSKMGSWLKGAPTAGASVGSMFGPVGAGVGATAGSFLEKVGGQKLNERTQLKALEKELKSGGETPINELKP